MNRELNYTRKFIILKTQYSTMKDLNPKGHGKMEGRGQSFNINFNIQGAESTNYYDVLLIGRDKAHRIGSIYTEENRRGSAEFNLSQKDLEAWGFPLGKINGILIIRNSNILLGGYFQKDDKTIDKYINSMGSEDLVEESYPDLPSENLGEEDHIEEAARHEVEKEEVYIEEERIDREEEGPISNEEVEIEAEAQAEVQAEEASTENHGPRELPGDRLLGEGYLKEEDLVGSMKEEFTEAGDGLEENIHKDFLEEDQEQEVLKKVSIEGQDYYAMDIEDIVSTEEYSEALEEVFPEGGYPEPDFYESLHMPAELSNRDMTLDYILNILNYFPYIEPFRISLKGYNWWKIDVENPENEQSFLPYFDYILNRDYNNLIVDNSITSSQLIKRYRHYIFGLFENKDGVKLYVYGIPGLFKREEYPQAGTTGFNTWFEGKDGPGYWLLYLEPSSGRILYPINPMIPME